MLERLAAYPYLGMCLIMLLVAAAAIWTERRNAMLLLFSGLLCIPYGLFSFEYIPDYWNPRVTFHYIASPEDLLFSFAGGVLATRMLLLFQHGTYTLSRERGLILRRYLLYSAIGIGIGYGVRFAFPLVPVMVSTLCGVGVTGLILAWKRWRFLAAAMLGSVSFAIAYAAMLKLAFQIWPSFTLAWEKVTFHTGWMLGLPLFELYWALGFGLVWPLMAVHCLLDEQAARRIASFPGTTQLRRSQ